MKFTKLGYAKVSKTPTKSNSSTTSERTTTRKLTGHGATMIHMYSNAGNKNHLLA